MRCTLSCNFIGVGDAVPVDGKPGRRATVQSLRRYPLGTAMNEETVLANSDDDPARTLA
jgi:hypothetical protein